MKSYYFLAGVVLVIMGFTKSIKMSEAATKPKEPVFSLHHRIQLPDSTVSNPPLLVLLHGFGSNENDLFNLSSELPKDWIIVAPQGPIALGNGSYCWYHLQAENGKISINTEEELSSRKKLLAFIAEIVRVYNADSSRILLAGFSQGAVLSLSTTLSNPEKIKGFATFSGRFPEEIRSSINASSEIASLKAFVAHGSRDQLLPMSYTSESLKILQQLGIQTTYCEDATGHTISSKQFSAFNEWLQQF